MSRKASVGYRGPFRLVEQPREIAPRAKHSVAVMVYERLRGDKRQQGRLRGFRREHAVHARPPLCQGDIDVTAVYERGGVQLPLKKKGTIGGSAQAVRSVVLLVKAASQESPEARKLACRINAPIR